MGKIILFNMVSLDGFFEAPGGSLDWHSVDREFEDFAIAQLDSGGGLVFGRVTYEFMAAFWPSGEAVKADPETAKRMNGLPKIVFSRTLKKAEWNNSRIVAEATPEKVRAMKADAAKDYLLFGSSLLASSLAAHHLIDEYRLMVNPVILGGGRPHFIKAERRTLDFVAARTFRNGNVLLAYQDREA